ncbi:MAG TPA: lamin tail domain-containing protein, partial [Polyangiaceae bacterium]
MKFIIALALVFMSTFVHLRAASALPADLFISEYVEGSSNNKALEIYNGTGAAVNLTAGDYTIEMYFNGALTSNLTHHLTSTVANNDVFVLTNSAAALPGILSASDQTTTSTAWYNGNDVVVLRKNNGGTIVDVIGQLGNSPTTEWGTGLTSTADNTLRRKASVCAGDPNGNDVFDPSVEWDGFAQDNVAGLGSHTASCGGGGDAAPTVSTVSPPNGGRLSTSGNLTVTFSEPVTAAAGAFSLICTTSGNVALAVTAGPTAFTLDPAVNLAASDACTLVVSAALVSDQDGTATPMAADFMSSFSVIPCGAAAISISTVQGSGLSSPLVGTVVEIEGVAVASFPGTSGLSGFFLQQQVGDGNAATSDGIFVFDPATIAQVQVGDVVRVRGKVDEFFDLTEINTLEFAVVCSSGAALPAPVTVSMPFATLDAPERFEGMRVSFPADSLFVTENFNQGRFGEVTLAAGGRQFSPTNAATPGPAADAVNTANLLSRIQLDDGSDLENPLPNVPYLGANGTLRPGDRVSNMLTGVLSYSFSTYEVHPTAPVTFAQTPRPSATPTVSGRLKVASYNILNFFTHLQPTSSSVGCGPTGALGCRGANTASEYTRQRAKTKASLVALAADIYGLAEIQNNTP